MILVNNFTEFYNILKTNNLGNTVSEFKEYVLLVERFKHTCSCRGSEKQRVKHECEVQYKSLVLTSVNTNITLFKNALGDGNIKFVQNNAIIKEYNV